MKVAFLGLGKMGLPMSRNIADAGHDLTVWNRTRERADSLSDTGVTVADSPAEAVKGAEIVCLSLTTPDVVESVVTGREGGLGSAASGSVWIDFSTIDMTTSQRIAAVCNDNGVAFLDAPVSGGPEGAEAGTLTVMIGGEDDAIKRATPILEAVGKNIVPVGPQGSALGIKMLNQMLVGANLAAVLEAFVLAKKAGIDLAVMHEVLSTSAGSSVMFTRNVPDFLMKESYEPGFALRLLVKDLDLVSQMGKEFEIPLMMPNLALQMFRNAVQAGLGDKDMSAAVIPLLEAASRVGEGEES
jgi:3-hydroxyisobutyrate dehydrogenase-like beta-hydroxyacid dehydrogenase